MSLEGRRLFIAIPSYDHKLNLNAAMALVELGQRAIEHRLAIHIRTLCGCSVVSLARNTLADLFLDTNCTDLLFIDSDVTFKATDVLRLLALAPQFDIVAGVYRMRQMKKIYRVGLDMSGDTLVMNKVGLVRGSRIGMGFTMIRRRVFEKLRDAHPEWAFLPPEEHKTSGTMYSFFDFKSTPEAYISEDCLFCDRAREAGFEVWIDPSIELGHMSTLELTGSYGEDAIKPMLAAARSQQEKAS